MAIFAIALCYAELGARVPRSGSAYTYIYVSIGEFVAFLIGWDIVLEYIIGIASVASSLSQNIDSVFDRKIHNAFDKHMPMNAYGLARSPDFLAFALNILVTSKKES